MGTTFDLILLSVIMFVLTFILGLIPMKCNVKPNYMNYIATAGAGLLLGTAFIVILPEGLDLLMEGIEEEVVTDHHVEEHAAKPFNGAILGLVIVTGIIFMLLVEHIGPTHTHGHTHQASPLADVLQQNAPCLQLTEVEELRPRPGNSVEELIISSPTNSKSNLHEGTVSLSVKKSGALTLGLVIHAAVDGIALGVVTAGGKNAKLSLMVFGALMGHKCPAAFSLSAILISKGVKRSHVIQNLIFFCAAAPIGALATYLIMGAGLSSISENSGTALGYCMLFSSGTFIGVIYEHILPELKRPLGKFTSLQLLIFTVGALIPIMVPEGDHH